MDKKIRQSLDAVMAYLKGEKKPYEVYDELLHIYFHIKMIQKRIEKTAIANG